MPLLKRKPYILNSPPRDLRSDEVVFQVRFTKEIFRDYEEYLRHVSLYRRRLWTCKVTGKQNLTYEEALVSERRATERVQHFPKEFMGPVLSMVQFSPLRIDERVDRIYKEFKDRFVVNEEALGTSGDSFCPCKIVKKPFSCPVSSCSSVYKRQDHLNRHLKGHEGIRFSCSIPSCDRYFSVKSNLQRHLKRHDERPDFPKPKSSGEKKHKCLQHGCEKVFRYRSLLQTHEDTVHGVVYAELICVYPGCGEKFAREAALLKHAVEAHPYLLCEVCGERISRKYYRRHVRRHGVGKPLKVICPYEGCTHHYTRESNLRQHIKSFHLKLKPYICSYDGCGKLFAHKCARNRHELSAVHVHTGTDFEAELQCSSISKGGRKKVQLDKVEDLYTKKSRVSQNASDRAKKKSCQEECSGVVNMGISLNFPMNTVYSAETFRI